MKQRAQTAREMTEEIDRATDAAVFAGSNEAGLGGAALNGAALSQEGLNGADLGRESLNGAGSNALTGVEMKGRSGEQARGIGNLAVGAMEHGQGVLSQAERGQGVFGQGERGQGQRSAGEYSREASGQGERVALFSREIAENERVREIAETDNGYARNEIAPNLSSVGEEGGMEIAERLAEDRGNLQAELSPKLSFDAKIQNKNQEEIGEVMAAEVGNIARKKSFSPSELVDLRNEGTNRMLESFKNPRKIGDRN